MKEEGSKEEDRQEAGVKKKKKKKKKKLLGMYTQIWNDVIKMTKIRKIFKWADRGKHRFKTNNPPYGVFFAKWIARLPK